MLKKFNSEPRSILVKLPPAEDALLRELAREKTLTATAMARILIIEALVARLSSRGQAEVTSTEGVTA